jgi:hypothetical protein
MCHQWRLLGRSCVDVENFFAEPSVWSALMLFLRRRKSDPTDQSPKRVGGCSDVGVPWDLDRATFLRQTRLAYTARLTDDWSHDLRKMAWVIRAASTANLDPETVLPALVNVILNDHADAATKTAGVNEKTPVEDINLLTDTGYHIAYEHLASCEYEQWVDCAIQATKAAPPERH